MSATPVASLPAAKERKGADPRVSLGCRWVNQRKAFGKPLHSLAVVRSKLALMISRVESQQSWLENITYQMCNMVRLLSRPPAPPRRAALI